MSESPPVIVRGVPDPNEPEAMEFYRIVGVCVCDWAFVDRRLYEFFQRASEMGDRQSALMYYRQRAFNQRLRLVDDAAKSYLSRANYDAHWRRLRQEAEDLAHTRNIFAHHPVRRTATSSDGKPLYIYEFHIEPYERVLNNNYPGLKGKTELGLDDLRRHNLAVMALEKALRRFLAGAYSKRGSGALSTSDSR